MEPKSFEDAIKRLEEIASAFEKEDIKLEEALRLYEEGMKLVEFCSAKLEEAQNRIRLITGVKNGKIQTGQFDGEAQ